MPEREVLSLELGDGWTIQAAGINRDKNGDLSADLLLQNGRLAHASRGVLNTSPGRVAWAREASGPERPSVSDLAAGLLDLVPEALAQLQAGDPKRSSQADSLVNLALASAELFHTPAGDAYATIPVRDHRETWPIRAKGFRLFLQRRYYEQFEKSPGSQAVQDALGVLEGRALFDGPEHPVFVRLAHRDDTLYLDLANERWEAVAITAHGWQIVASPPVRFRRAKGMLALPHPVPGGKLDSLRQFVNVASEQDWCVLVAWLVAAARPVGPYPVLVLHGEQGSGKSSVARLLRRMIDPNGSELRAEPRELRDLMIAGANSHVVSYDNLSRVPDWLSDALCRLSTGGGFATRELYSNDDETIFEAKRPIILNGIEELATRADLLDRAILVYLPTIPEERRRPETAFWTAFDHAQPTLLGALLDVVSGALARLPSVHLSALPRMADFALWATAAEASLGWTPGAFMAAYTVNRRDANRLALDVSLVAEQVLALVAEVNTWEGTMTELLSALNGRLDDDRRKTLERDKLWPKTASGLSNMLRRLAPNLRAEGVNFTPDLRDQQRRRIVRLEKVRDTPSAASAASASAANEFASGRESSAGADGADAADGKMQADSQAWQSDSDYCLGCGRVLPNADARALGLCAACRTERVS